nr:calcium-binding protein 8-like [Odocoileus virginianus texanus]
MGIWGLEGACSFKQGTEGTPVWGLSYQIQQSREIREAFRVLDRDGNGFISKQELGMAMRSLGYMPSEVELAIIMQRLDMDGDGQVDFDEFMTILGPKLVSSEGRDGFLGNTIDSIFWQSRVLAVIAVM